ncbi:hypothetical protein D3C71_152470 [compost metagenome]
MEAVSAGEIETTESKAKRSRRVRNWTDGIVAAAAIISIPVTHLLTEGLNKGFLLGTIETTMAGAIASCVIGTLVGGRIIDQARNKPVDKAIMATVIGTCIVVTGASTMPLLVADMNQRAAVMEAHQHGADELMRAGRIAETRPHEDVRKVTGAVTMELLVDSFRPTYSDAEIKEFDRKITEKWKSLGFDKSPER